MESLRYILTGSQCCDERARYHRIYMDYLSKDIPEIIQERGGGDLGNPYRKVHEIFYNLLSLIHKRKISYRKMMKAEEQYARDWYKLLTGKDI